MDLFWFLGSTCCCCVFYGNDFVVAVIVAVAVVLYFEYVDFVVFAAGAVHTLFVHCVPTVVEIVVVVVVVADDVVVVIDLRQFGHFFLLIKNQTPSIEFPFLMISFFWDFISSEK